MTGSFGARDAVESESPEKRSVRAAEHSELA
jgi:hypothetical protein